MYMNKVVLQVLFVNCSCEGSNWLKPNTHMPVKNKLQTSKEKKCLWTSGHAVQC